MYELLLSLATVPLATMNSQRQTNKIVFLFPCKLTRSRFLTSSRIVILRDLLFLGRLSLTSRRWLWRHETLLTIGLHDEALPDDMSFGARPLNHGRFIAISGKDETNMAAFPDMFVISTHLYRNLSDLWRRGKGSNSYSCENEICSSAIEMEYRQLGR